MAPICVTTPYKHKVVYESIEPHFFYRTLYMIVQIACKKKKQYPHKQQTTPTYKIKSKKPKTSNNLLSSKNQSINCQTWHIKQKKIGKLVTCVGIAKRKKKGLRFKWIK
jgi:hypothetical protein